MTQNFTFLPGLIPFHPGLIQIRKKTFPYAEDYSFVHSFYGDDFNPVHLKVHQLKVRGSCAS